jgi:GGDEF domain-containing protein
MRVGELTMRASLGHAVFPRDGDTEAALLHVADEAMYARKRDRVDRPTELRRLA